MMSGAWPVAVTGSAGVVLSVLALRRIVLCGRVGAKWGQRCCPQHRFPPESGWSHTFAMGDRAQLVWCEARLTNHHELTRQLGVDPDTSDAGVVAAAVARWGDDTPRHLLGAYAYAVETPGGVAITRDALGVMPAYWARDTNRRLHVSDSLTTLAALDGVDVSPDGEFLAAEAVRVVGLRPDRTAMVGVRRVPPGTTVQFPTSVGVSGGGDLVVTRWWDPACVPNRRGVSVDDAAQELRDLLVEAVGDHLAMVQRRGGAGALDGVAAHLSGGLDSTVVAFVAARWLADSDRSLRAVVSWSPQRNDNDQAAEAVADYGFDERDVIENLAGELGAPVWLGPADLGEAPWLANRDPSTFPRSTNMRESWAAEAYQGLGVNHVLSGWGGDEFVSFNGRGTNRAIVRAVRLGALRSAYRDRRRRGQGRVRALGRPSLRASPGSTERSNCGPVWVRRWKLLLSPIPQFTRRFGITPIG